MKKYFLLIFFYQAILLSIIAQTSYKPGYIIKNNGDTVKGYIFFSSSHDNSKECKFKPGIDSEYQSYIPGEINSYRFIDSKYYVSTETKVNNEQQKVFLEWLIKGKLNLFLYVDADLTKHYFIQKEGDTLVELHNTKRKIEGDALKKYQDSPEFKYLNLSASGTYYFDRKEYMGELSYILKEYPDLTPSIRNTTYDNKSLINFAKKYHNKVCSTEDCIVFEKTKEKLKFKVGVVAEYYTSNLFLKKLLVHYDIVSGEKLFVSVPVKKTHSINPCLFFNISQFPLISPNFSLHMEFAYYNLTYEIINNQKICSLTQLRSILNIEYSLPIKKILQFNVAIGVVKYSRLSWNAYGALVPYQFEGNDYKAYLIMQKEKSQNGINFQFGIEKNLTKNISILLNSNYEYCTYFTHFNTPGNSVTKNLSLQLGIGCKIN